PHPTNNDPLTTPTDPDPQNGIPRTSPPSPTSTSRHRLVGYVPAPRPTYRATLKDNRESSCRCPVPGGRRSARRHASRAPTARHDDPIDSAWRLEPELPMILAE